MPEMIKVFLSCTSKDLTKYRKAVAGAEIF